EATDPEDGVAPDWVDEPEDGEPDDADEADTMSQTPSWVSAQEDDGGDAIDTGDEPDAADSHDGETESDVAPDFEDDTPEFMRISLPMALCRALLEKAGIAGEPTESAVIAALEKWV
ncbi:MAG: hypothetical protein ACP5E2_16960, partial [Terracidiphilus sp.]